jgi:predicted transcriptional regulator
MTEKERFTTTLDSQLLEDIKILAVKRKCSTNVLIEEAIKDLLEKVERESKDKERGNLFK